MYKCFTALMRPQRLIGNKFETQKREKKYSNSFNIDLFNQLNS